MIRVPVRKEGVTRGVSFPDDNDVAAEARFSLGLDGGFGQVRRQAGFEAGHIYVRAHAAILATDSSSHLDRFIVGKIDVHKPRERLVHVESVRQKKSAERARIQVR